MKVIVGGEVFKFAAEPVQQSGAPGAAGAPAGQGAQQGGEQGGEMTPDKGKKIQLSGAQIDALSKLVMVGISALLIKEGTDTVEEAKDYDFRNLITQLPQILKTVAMDRNTLQAEARKIMSRGPENYVKQLLQQLKSGL